MTKPCLLLTAPLLAFGLLACSASEAPAPTAEIEATVSQGPQSGKADGLDKADRDCQLVLRDAARISDGRGGFEATDNSNWVFEGHIDVAKGALDEGATLKVLYTSSAITSPEFGRIWWTIDAKPTGLEAPEGVKRFEFRIERPGFGPGMSGSALERARLDLIPYLQTREGGRLFEHNRLEGDFDIYSMTLGNDWSVDLDEVTCNAAATPQGPAWVGNPTIKISRGSTAICGGRDVRELKDSFEYEGWARQRAVVRSFCFEAWEPGVTDWDNPDLWKTLNVQIHYSWRGSVNWHTEYVSQADRVGNNARYGYSIGQLDPFAWPNCPSGVVVDGSRAIVSMEFYATVNGVELKNEQGENFIGEFTIHAANWAQRCQR